MWKYCLKKTAQVVIVMILISFFSFAIVYFAPGDISDMYVNPEMTEEQKANVIAQLGLDKSMTEQYFAWAKRAVHGDLGVSLSNKSAVWPQFMQRLPATIILMGSSMILSLLLAIPLGLWSGYKKNSWLDNLISSLAYMKQRLQIARGLINDPEYIFLDEPTLGLDIVIAKEIRTMIKELAQEGKKGVLLTTHYISEAEELCDYIYVLDKGRMIAQGTKEELKDLFASEPKMVLQEPGLEEILMKIIYRSRGEDSEENIFGNKSRN